MAEENFEDSFELEEDVEEDPPFDFDDEFDRLRQKTARTSAVYDEMDLDDELIVEDERGFFDRISPAERLILLVLLLLDIVVIAIGLMALFGVI